MGISLLSMCTTGSESCGDICIVKRFRSLVGLRGVTMWLSLVGGVS